MADPALATKSPESDAMEDIPTTDTATTTTAPTTKASLPSTTQTITSPLSTTDSPAQTGPTMGEHCTSDRPLPSSLSTSTSSGTISTLNGIETYISKPADYPSTPAKLLLLLTGGTGIHSLNNQLQADRFASAGYLVVMPDQFAGDAAPGSGNRVTSPSSNADTAYQSLPTTTTDTTAPPPSPSLLDRIKLGFADTAKSFMLDMWLARQTPEKVLPRLLSVIEAIQDEYADAIAHGGGIYGVGYCFGAKYILILARGEGGVGKHPALSGLGFDFSGLSAALPNIPAMPALPNMPNVPSLARLPSVGGVFGGVTASKNGEGDVEAAAGAGASTSSSTDQAPSAPEPTPQETEPALPTQPTPTAPLIKAATIAHGTLITHSDVLDLHPSVPLYCVAVEDDPLFPAEILEVARKAWASNKAECKVEVFGGGVPHGFAVVGEYADPKIRGEQERAWIGMRGWLDGH